MYSYWVLLDSSDYKELARIKLDIGCVRIKDYLLEYLNDNEVLMFRLFHVEQ